MQTMGREEAICRRYCAFLGLNPDEIIQGVIQWRICRNEIQAIMNVMDTMHIQFENPFDNDIIDAAQLELNLPNNNIVTISSLQK